MNKNKDRGAATSEKERRETEKKGSKQSVASRQDEMQKEHNFKGESEGECSTKKNKQPCNEENYDDE